MGNEMDKLKKSISNIKKVLTKTPVKPPPAPKPEPLRK